MTLPWPNSTEAQAEFLEMFDRAGFGDLPDPDRPETVEEFKARGGKVLKLVPGPDTRPEVYFNVHGYLREIA